MSINRTYRGLVVVVALFVVLGLADRAFSYRLTNFATAVVSDVVAEVVELATPSPSRPKAARASAGSMLDLPRSEFPSVAEPPGGFGGFGFGDQPPISLGGAAVIEPDARVSSETADGAATSSVPGSAARRLASAGGRSAATGGGFGSGGVSSGAGGPRLTSRSDAAEGGLGEAAGAATLSTHSGAMPAIGLQQASSLAERWSESVAEQWSDAAGIGASGAGGGSGAGLSTGPGHFSTDPSHASAGDVGAFGDTQYGFGDTQDGSVSPGGSIATGSLSEALAFDSATGGSGLDVQAILDVSAVRDVPGAAPSDPGPEWLRQFRSEAGLNPGSANPSGQAAIAADDDLIVLPEPGMLAVFGIGLLALAARIRSRPNRKLAD